MVRAGGERLRGVGADPRGSPVQLGASASAFVRARCMLMSLLLCLVSSLAPCLVSRDRERSDAAVRVRASSPLEGSRPSRWWGRDSGLGSMQVPWMARVASRLSLVRVVLGHVFVMPRRYNGGRPIFHLAYHNWQGLACDSL